eukprot:TRINITY_DN4596_c5_g1_i1.p1 TRINITY_DN4596_c5_g1~~TRINITY_DN4596_c5_g1_i1.p1  ORF type:complete len:278 (+),score=66.39 TRINITY_DN4596_c5_g1_i1:64-897(+)
MKATMSMMLLSAAVVSCEVSIGDRLIRTFTKYVPMPVTMDVAKKTGWAPSAGSQCDPNYGIPYVNASLGLSRHAPTTMYFTPAGQVSGMSVDVFVAAPPQNLINLGYFVKIDENRYRLGLSFRENSCDTANQSTPIGTRIMVGPGTANKSLPLTRNDAVASNWFAGSCFAGMGTHYFYDLSTAPKMSWNADQVLPVVTMFNNAGDIQAIFFASTIVQEQDFSPNTWEPIPLTNPLMCMNTCDPACSFAGTAAWSTYHVYFKDLSAATCQNNCTMACC